MKNLIITAVLITSALSTFAQVWDGSSINTTITNPDSYPYGVSINTTYSSGWAREFSFTRNGAGKFLAFGALGNGDSFTYGYIGGNSGHSHTYAAPWMVFKGDGKIGIGTTSPTEKLDVNGTARLRGVTQDTTQTRVLVTDTNGKIYWRNVSTISNSNLIHNTGVDNIFVGLYSGDNISSGHSNTANGAYALHYNTTGDHNTANGYLSLFRNTTGFDNTANGHSSLRDNTTGGYNTANGYQSLRFNTTGNSNTANGYKSLYSNITGFQNTANGVNSLSDTN